MMSLNSLFEQIIYSKSKLSGTYYNRIKTLPRKMRLGMMNAHMLDKKSRTDKHIASNEKSKS